MASFPGYLLLFFFVLNLSYACASSYLPFSFVLPVTKDPSTLQYLTSLSYGTPLVPAQLVLDLGGSSLWIDCSSRNLPSSSLRTIPSRSIQCLMAKSHNLEAQTQLPDQRQPCQSFPENTITGMIPREGNLVRDVVALQSVETGQPLIFTCSLTQQLNGLAIGAKGMAGLGGARSSLSSQIFDSVTAQRKITLCFSSSSGAVLFGRNSYESQPEGEIFRSLTYTPLFTNQKGYFIIVNSIKIDRRRLSLSLPKDQHTRGTTQLSSIVPYTTMESSIYDTFKKAYMKAASAMNMTRVTSVAPFELCFSSKGIDNVPMIDLVLQSELVKWRIYGRNSMVRLSSEVMCLGFVDGGLNPEYPIVIGGYQLEDVIVQFDLDTSMVGFSSSLLLKHSSCSHFKSGFTSAESI
ncbi:gamma conglutin 1-like [Neltuma alba]|uniref:gamma conglutin 1-like n=1 Tax=Neltuma alba TaxID=207710 RepID=UPI0010A4CB71|nr:gamma conglutin 1-like [Prosopis alba]XP_028795185.1 gamma conglutin 1-like [Prosopis alba]